MFILLSLHPFIYFSLGFVCGGLCALVIPVIRNYLGSYRTTIELNSSEIRLNMESLTPEQTQKIIERIKQFENTDDKLIEEQIAKLKKGYLNFTCPEWMKIGKKENVVAEIFKDEKLLETVNKDNVEEIKVANFMKVKLSGSSFDIVPLNNSESQFISANEKTTWTWDVTPKSSGERKLVLSITAEIKIAGSKEARDYPIIEKVIDVQVDRIYTTKMFIKKNWQWMVGTVAGSGVVFSLLKAFGVIK